MDELLVLQGNDDRSVTIPADVRDRLHPGDTLVLEAGEDGKFILHIRTENGPALSGLNREAGPRLVRKGSATIIEGEVEEGFDWDAFMNEYRESSVHGWNPLSDETAL